MNKDIIKDFSNQELASKLQSLCAKEREAIAEVILHLIEFDSRKLYLELGFSSLFVYCTKALRYSESAAMRRISAVRCMRVFPEIYGLFVEGRLSLSVIGLLSSKINSENSDALIPRVMDKSRSEAEVELNRGERVPEVKELIRPVVKVKVEKPEAPLFLVHESHLRCGGGGNPQRSQESVTDEERFELHFSISKRAMEKLRKAQARCADGHRLEAVFEKLLDSYLEAAEPKRNRPVSGRRTRYITKAVKSEVLGRDGHRCSFVSKNGRRCDATRALQIDHRAPFAKGGGNGPENLRLLCPAHNRLEARREFPDFKLDMFQS